MKKILGFILLIISISLYSQSSFDSGFKKGFCEGYKDKCGPYRTCPTSPIAPIPTIYQSSDSYTDGYNTGFKKGMSRGQKDCDENKPILSNTKSSLSTGAYANPQSPELQESSTQELLKRKFEESRIREMAELERKQELVSDLTSVGVVGAVLLADILINSIKEKKARKLEEIKEKKEEIEYSKKEIKEATKRIELDPNNEINYFNRAVHKEKLGIYSFDDYDKACNLGHEKSCSNRNIGEFLLKILSDSIYEGETFAESWSRKSFIISEKYIELDPYNPYPYYLRARNKEQKGYPSFFVDYKRACDLGEKEACKEYKKRKNMQLYNVVDSLKFSHCDLKLNLNCWNITITPDKKFIIFTFFDENNEQYASVYYYNKWEKLLGPFKINRAAAVVYTENSSEKIYFMSMFSGVILNTGTLKLQNSEIKYKKLVELEKSAGKNYNGKSNSLNSKRPEIRIDNNLIIAGADYFSIWKNQ